MQAFKQRMSFTKREQYAIVFLMFVMVILLIVNIFPGLVIRPELTSYHNLDSIALTHGGKLVNEPAMSQSENFDAANPERAALDLKLHPFQFNPNKLPASEWKKIGLNDKQIQNILNYEKSGGKFFKKSDLQKIYSLTLAEYKILEPYIEIPETNFNKPYKSGTTEKDSVSTTENIVSRQIIYELNTIDSNQLIGIKDIGPWFAHRILQYRRSLGGFLSIEQLREVYGIDSARYNIIVRNVTLKNVDIQLLAVNKRTFKELIRHPYMNYNLTKAIVNKRERQGFVKSWNELVSLNANDSVSILRLKPYLDFN
ncbi:MAG: competence protein ComEA [Bacteroidales bacterium]|nr:competence protein ComEA [Bacteroidales bacterium]